MHQRQSTIDEKKSSRAPSISTQKKDKKLTANDSIASERGRQVLEKFVDIPMESSKREMLERLEELTKVVEWTLDHVEGDLLLNVPQLSDLPDTKDAEDLSILDKTVIDELEKIVTTWGKHIHKMLDQYLNKLPQGKGPIAEFEYWHDRETGLSMLVEQLKKASAKKILSILQRVESPVISGFTWSEIELWKNYTHARDNKKFLDTVLRYFKLLSETDDFRAIGRSIPSLMEGMKMIWVLSKYYSSEEVMVTLLERISWQLCQNIVKNLAIKDVFKKSLDEVSKRTEDAYFMMKNWKASYLKTREGIEISGKGVRWEFDQPKLFKETEYIAKVCNDLNKIASVLQDFYNIFGPELKSVINDPSQIDTIVKKVDEMIMPIQNADFNVWTEFNKENWEATMDFFYHEVENLEKDAKFFIDECFMVLISAEQALEVLLKFKNIKTRQAIQEQLLLKFDVIMQQFSKEINEVEGIFNRGMFKKKLINCF